MNERRKLMGDLLHPIPFSPTLLGEIWEELANLDQLIVNNSPYRDAMRLRISQLGVEIGKANTLQSRYSSNYMLTVVMEIWWTRHIQWEKVLTLRHDFPMMEEYTKQLLKNAHEIQQDLRYKIGEAAMQGKDVGDQLSQWQLTQDLVELARKTADLCERCR
jgi:hypothetical protein